MLEHTGAATAEDPDPATAEPTSSVARSDDVGSRAGGAGESRLDESVGATWPRASARSRPPSLRRAAGTGDQVQAHPPRDNSGAETEKRPAHPTGLETRARRPPGSGWPWILVGAASEELRWRSKHPSWRRAWNQIAQPCRRVASGMVATVKRRTSIIGGEGRGKR